MSNLLKTDLVVNWEVETPGEILVGRTFSENGGSSHGMAVASLQLAQEIRRHFKVGEKFVGIASLKKRVAAEN